MDTEDFIAKYPTLLHLAHAESWPSIQQHGLLSTEQLLRRWHVDADRAEAHLSQKRPEPVHLSHPEHGLAVLRDQHPLTETQLAPALTDGMTVADWLRLLNSHVFFFPNETGLRTLYSAYRPEPAVVIKVRTRSLVRVHEARVRLAGINTGNTSRRPAPRGADTFLPIRRYDHRKRAVQEVAVLDEVSDLHGHLISAQTWNPDGTIEHLLG